MSVFHGGFVYITCSFDDVVAGRQILDSSIQENIDTVNAPAVIETATKKAKRTHADVAAEPPRTEPEVAIQVDVPATAAPAAGAWQSILRHLRTGPVTPEDPSVVLDFRRRALDQFIAAANALVGPARPAFLPAGVLTSDVFIDALIQHLRAVGGGSFGQCLIGPNTLQQFTNVVARLVSVELDPWVQAAMASLPVGTSLALTATITDRSVAAAQPLARAAPDGGRRQVFE